MTIEFDDKGKFYTDVITKVVIPATIVTIAHRITGLIHVRPEQRMKDELDKDEKFMAVTDATVYSMQGEILQKCDFLAIQRSQIIYVVQDSRQ
jgi:hypothetical protein